MTKDWYAHPDNIDALVEALKSFGDTGRTVEELKATICLLPEVAQSGKERRRERRKQKRKLQYNK